MAILLVHSPLLGPNSMRPLADAIADQSDEMTIVADLSQVITRFVDSGYEDSGYEKAGLHPAFVDAAVDAATVASADVSVVAHSGAGAFLPSIGAALGTHLNRLVFVDAIVPAAEGVHGTPEEMRAMIDDKVDPTSPESNRMMRPWFDWWPDGVLEQLVPNDGLRAALAHDTLALPRSYYDEIVELPSGWSDWQCCFLQLSEAYSSYWEVAEERGWRTAILPRAHHLSVATEPERVASVVLNLIADIPDFDDDVLGRA